MNNTPTRVRIVRTLGAIVVGGAAMATIGGCLERRIYIASDPPGAIVRLNDVEVGRTPLEVDFTYYGVYDVRLEKDGYEPLSTSAEAKAPVYEWPLIDLVAEAMPKRILTEIRWDFTLRPVETDPDVLIERARGMRRIVGAEAAPNDAETTPENAGQRDEVDSQDDGEEPVELPPLTPGPLD